jgi:hypothetical protein
MMCMRDVLAVQDLHRYLMDGNVVPAVRVSSAQARGRAKRWLYWGAVRYEVRWSPKRGRPTAQAVERASSDRRSRRLAEQDAETLAERTGAIEIYSIGELSYGDLLEAARWVALCDQ